MEVEYSLSPDDLVAFHQYDPRRATSAAGTSRGSQLVAMLLAMGCLGALALAGIAVVAGRWSSQILHLLLLGLLAGVAAVPILFRERLLSSYTRWYYRHAGSQYFSPQRLKLTPEALIISSAAAETTTRWEGIERITVTHDYAFFFNSQNSAFLLPRRAFANEQDFLAFVEAAQRYQEAARAAKT